MLVVLRGVARPMHVHAIRPRIRLELVEIFVEMGERVLLDRGGERAQLLPFGNAVHLAVALLPQIPEPLVMHFLVLGRGDEPRRRLRLIDRPVAVDPCAARLRFGRCGAAASKSLRHGRGGGRGAMMESVIVRAPAAPDAAWRVVVGIPGVLMRWLRSGSGRCG